MRYVAVAVIVAVLTGVLIIGAIFFIAVLTVLGSAIFGPTSF